MSSVSRRVCRQRRSASATMRTSVMPPKANLRVVHRLASIDEGGIKCVGTSAHHTRGGSEDGPALRNSCYVAIRPFAIDNSGVMSRRGRS